MLDERAAEGFRAAETAAQGCVGNRVPGVKQVPGGVEPDQLDVPGRRGLELVVEQPRQVARADVGQRGERGQRVVAGRIGGQGVAQQAQRRGTRQRRPQRRRELRLAAGTLQEDNQGAGDVTGKLSAVVAFDQGEGEVDAGGDAGRGEDRAVLYVDRVGHHRNRRVRAGQYVRVPPVRSRPAVVEQARRGEYERSRADGGGSLCVCGEHPGRGGQLRGYRVGGEDV